MECYSTVTNYREWKTHMPAESPPDRPLIKTQKLSICAIFGNLAQKRLIARRLWLLHTLLLAAIIAVLLSLIGECCCRPQQTNPHNHWKEAEREKEAWWRPQRRRRRKIERSTGVRSVGRPTAKWRRLAKSAAKKCTSPQRCSLCLLFGRYQWVFGVTRWRELAVS